MKNLLSLIGILSLLFISSCKKDRNTDLDPKTNIIPRSNMTIAVPSALSEAQHIDEDDEYIPNKNNKDNILSGDDIYGLLRVYVGAGDQAGQFAQFLINSVYQMNLTQDTSITYPSSDDNRNKTLTITSNVTLEGIAYDYELTIRDQSGDLGLQMAWNNTPLKGLFILNPFNLNREDTSNPESLYYRVDYSEKGELGFEKHMIVTVSELPLVLTDQFSINKVKMVVGKTGDIISIYGNSNHPNVRALGGGNEGINWAFRANINTTENIGVAEIGLPPVSLTDSTIIFTNYSIRDVLSDALNPIFNDSIVNSYLTNASAPGYFDSTGFISGGANVPDSRFSQNNLNILTGLTPFAPYTVNGINLSFIE